MQVQAGSQGDRKDCTVVQVEVTVEVLLYQPARGQDWCAEQTFDVSCYPDSEVSNDEG